MRKTAQPLTSDQQKLVAGNLNVADIAAAKMFRRYRGGRTRDEVFPELQASALFGLCKAASCWDDRGVTFRKYALACCIAQIRDDQLADRLVHIPRYLQDRREEPELKIARAPLEHMPEEPPETATHFLIECTESERAQVLRLLRRLRDGKPVRIKQIPPRLLASFRERDAATTA